MLSPFFSLDNFEGPLELLIGLIQKEEIDICTISLKNLTWQMLGNIEEANIDVYSEILSLTATLLLLKSRKLLPHPPNEVSEDLIQESRLEWVQNLIDYSRLKEAAQNLAVKEEEQRAFFSRGSLPLAKERESGLEEVSLDNLKTLLVNLLQRVKPTPIGVIRAPLWTIADKMTWLRRQIKEAILFGEVFSEDKGREELIVLFLALLEMMKHQELKVVRKNDFIYIMGNVN